MKLNLGCGGKRVEGFIGVDKFHGDAVDLAHDLESLPWPFETDSVDAVLMHHVLEHLGQQTSVYLGIIRELYRVCRAGATINIRVPHPRHDDFINDPTHVRAITPEGMELLSRASCEKWRQNGYANTPLAFQIGVDFAITHVGLMLDDAWKKRDQDIGYAMRCHNNVIKEIAIDLVVVKP